MDVRGSCRPCMGAVPSAKHTRQRRSRPQGRAAPGPTLARLTRVPSRLESACSARSASRSARSLLSFCCAKNSAHSAARRRCSSPHLRMTTFCSSSKALWDKGVRARGECPGHVAGPAAERARCGGTHLGPLQLLALHGGLPGHDPPLLLQRALRGLGLGLLRAYPPAFLRRGQG